MDMRSWKKVILQWVTECGFMERNYFNIEQSDIDIFYQKFYTQHPKTVNGKYKRISDFLKEFYPNFEFHLDDENCLSSADYIYTYSMFLHFCCVRYPETRFHEICQRLPENAQQCIASFFKELLDIEALSKETLRHAIARVLSSNITPPRSNQLALISSQSMSSFNVTVNSSGTGGSETSTSGSVTSPNYMRCDSPSKTPKRSAGQQRVSPPTPKSYLLEERTRDLYNLRAQLETERYEKGILEVQIKQNDDKILKLNQEQKKLMQQIQDLKNDSLLKASEGNNSTNRDGEDQISKRLLKEIGQKENELTKLTDLLQTQREENALTREKLNYAEKQIVQCIKRIKDLQSKVDELSEEVEKNKDTIKYLTDSKLELEQFIRDTRAVRSDLNSSSDCFESSFVRNIGNADTSSNVSSPENLGVSVVDVQLREKEHENSKLKEELELVKNEHKKLAKNLHDLTAKQAKEFNIAIEPNLSDSKQSSEHNESSKRDPLEQLNLFFSCMETIKSYHKLDKQKIKDLEDENFQLKGVNKELTDKLCTLTNEMATFKQTINSVKLINEDLLKSKEDMQLSLDASNLEREQLRLHKDEILFELREIKASNETLTKSLANLQEELLLSQKCNRVLKKNHEDQSQNMESQLEVLKTSSQDKIKDTDLEINRLSQKLIEQADEIDACISAERSLKLNYEKTLVENEQLKQNAREANTHLQAIKKDLVGKQSDIDILAKEIAYFEEKKKCLEDNIDRIIKKFQQEKIMHEHEKAQFQEKIRNCQETMTNLESKHNQESFKTKQEIEKLQIEISNLQNVIDESSNTNVAKLRETEELQRMLYDVISPKINHLLKLLNVPAVKEGCLENIRILATEVESLHQHKIESTILLKSLELQAEHSCTKIEHLSKDLNEKNKSLILSTEECAQLHQKCNDFEATIEKLQEKQEEFVEKVKHREQELTDSMRQASREYEDSLERIHVELKRQNENHNERERELLLVISEHNDVKKQLNEKELELEQLSKENCLLHQENEKIHMLESRVAEYSAQNDKLQKEINLFKHQVHQNAMRLVEADNALTDLMDITKDYDLKKAELREITILLEEKEIALQHESDKQRGLQLELKKQKENVSKLTDHLKYLEEHNNQQMHNIEDYVNQIRQVQEEKSLLLKSLEKSTDQLKLSIEEKEHQINSLEQTFKDVKEQLEAVTMQNTQLQGDLIEREAELRVGQEDHQQEREKYQQEIQQLQQQLAESSEQLEAFDMSLMEILVIMENNFNLSKELDNDDDSIKNVFNSQQLQEKVDKLQPLRQNLNRLLYLDSQLQSQMGELTVKLEEQTTFSESSKKTITDLELKLKLHDIELGELREQVENEEVIAEKRVSLEICRLENDLQNLEKVNEQLSHGNVEMQVAMENLEQNLKTAKSKLDQVEEEKVVLNEEVCTKNKLLEKQKNEAKKNQQTIKEKNQQLDALKEKYKLIETQQKEKTVKVQALEKDLQVLKEKSIKQQQKITQQQQQLDSLFGEQNKVQENLKRLHALNDSLENEVDVKAKEIMGCNNKIRELLQSNENSENQLELTIKKLDECEALKINNETKCERMLFETQQLQRDIEFLKSQQQSAVDESQRLTSEMESLKQDKHHLRDEIRDTKSDLQRANDNVSQLIQQISSIRLEKDYVVEENNLLKKQLEDTGKNHSSSETKLKSIVEGSQDLERKLLAAENELKSVKATLDKSELNAQRLTSENKKLRATQETSTKRIEKLALKLGDSQARGTKLERDNDKLAKTLEANAATVEALQKEKDLLQNEARSLKERVLRAERSHEQLASKVQNLEHLNCQLQETKQKLEASEIDGQCKLSKLEKVRDSNEEKIKRLTNALNSVEHSNVKLTLEIGALNSQLYEFKAKNTNELLQVLQRQLETVQQQCSNYEEQTARQQVQLDALTEEKSMLADQLSKAHLSLKISKEQCTELTTEVKQLRAEIVILRGEISRTEMHEKALEQQLKNFELKNDTLVHEREVSVAASNARIISLEEKLSEKCTEVNGMQQEIHKLQKTANAHSALIMQQSENQSQSEDLEKLRVKLSMADETLAREQQIISQLNLDNQILHTKYKESKQRALDAAKISEERIKENRLELEGKLEKMKNKMLETEVTVGTYKRWNKRVNKTLYTEEITKMKTKQDREMAVIKSEMEVLKTQNSKYEEHMRKLSNQIVRLNDNILEYQKDNTILSTKLKHLLEQQQHNTEKFKRPNSIHVSTISSSTSSVAAPNIGTNLAMEDEEGEVFNNTYLTDLKAGAMSEFMSREVCVEELKYRNSLCPPHLKSSYAAQFDHECPDDELKDGPHSMDDSMSALLSTTAGGTRKKCTGVTHYKRPGPPTPSKNGRLSFGGIGSSEPAREILKESFGSNAVSSSKTPARFTFFSSRFSMGNAKDENNLVKHGTKETNSRENINTGQHYRYLCKDHGVVCTSTPRKSKDVFDKRRLIKQLLTSSPSPSPLPVEHKKFKMEKKMSPPDLSIIETPLTSFPTYIESAKAPSRKQTTTKRLEAIATGLKNRRRNSSVYGRRLSRRMEELCTPTSGETTSSAALSNTPKDKKLVRRQTINSLTSTTSGGMSDKAPLRSRRAKPKTQNQKGAKARPSLHLRGNMFVKYRAPSKRAQHDLNTQKSRKQRKDHFNQGRNLKLRENDTSEEADEETMIRNLTYDIRNNNYAPLSQNRNDKLMCHTLVLKKGHSKGIEKDINDEMFTNATEMFESMEPYMEKEHGEWSPYDEDDSEEEYNEARVGNNVLKNDEYDKKYEFKYSIPIKKESCKQELVSSFDLEEFDRFISKSNKKEDNNLASFSSNGSSVYFEKLIRKTESNAPFPIKHIDFKDTPNNSSHLETFGSSSELQNQHDVSTATPHISPGGGTTTGHSSRTIYGGTVIYNRRLPNINTTYVRKSSIYIRNNNDNMSGSDDIVLITNQTITLVDLARMWWQMDSSTRLIVSFAAMASVTTLLGLFLSFWPKR